jgi:hypothetical protein
MAMILGGLGVVGVVVVVLVAAMTGGSKARAH